MMSEDQAVPLDSPEVIAEEVRRLRAEVTLLRQEVAALAAAAARGYRQVEEA